MNWLQKIAGRTFKLQGSEKISQPKNVDHLGHELQRFASEKSGSYIDINTITSDGDSLGQDTGVINWYITDELTEEQRRQIMQSWIQDKELMGYQIQVTGPERSGMSGMLLKTYPAATDRNNPNSELMVYRIHILKNGSLDYMEIPEMHINQVNSGALLEALGISERDGVGSIDLNELKTKLEMFTPWSQQETTRDPEQSDENNVQWFDGGYTENQINRHISILNQMVDFGLKNGFTTLEWH